MLNVTVRFHAGAREAAAVSETPLQIADDGTVAMLKDHLLQQFPGLERFRGSLLFAVREDYVTPESRLQDGDVVSCFPPVSGG